MPPKKPGIFFAAGLVAAAPGAGVASVVGFAAWSALL
jgi:hypothetical protein